MTPGLAERIARFRRFHAAPSGLALLAWYRPPGFAAPPPLPLDGIDWRDEGAIRRFARRELERFRAARDATAWIDDDRVPAVMAFAGTGLAAACVVRDARLSQRADTNYLAEPQGGWDELADRLAFRPDNPWYLAHTVLLRAFVEAWDGSFGIMPFAHFGPTDLAHQLRGTELFTDLYEHEAGVHRLLARAADAVLDTEADLRAHHLGGYAVDGFSFGSWAPRGGYLSCDFGDLVSPDVLRRFERPHADRILEAWGGGYVHHHELGRHQVPVWAESGRVGIQEVHRDPNTAHLADGIDETVLASSRRTPIQFSCDAAAFLEHADRWARGRFVVEVGCATPAEVERVMERAEPLRAGLGAAAAAGGGTAP